MEAAAQTIFELKGKVQHYSWGGYDFIPRLLGIENNEQQPYAEYWMGAHPNYSSTININGEWVALNEYIADSKHTILGEETAAKFGSLPYLFKVLDVRQMLSIQVHPDKASAQINFETENAAGIPPNAPYRNYKDANHKPELMVALSDFWLLHGFKAPDLLKELLAEIPDFTFLLQTFERGGYQALYEQVMTMPQDEVNTILTPIINRILPLYENDELQKSHEDFWAARAAKTFCNDGNYDRGIFSIYFFNLVQLKKGEGIYQPAQLPHAYLEGQNVELMANSDNVLRAGLTDKHIDVPELLKYVRFEETIPKILGSETITNETVFETPAEEFEITHYQYAGGNSFAFTTHSADILLVLSGAINIAANGQSLSLQKGQSAFITSGTTVTVDIVQNADFFRAAVPQNGKTRW